MKSLQLTSRRLAIVVPLVLLTLLVFWRLAQKRADVAEQAAQRAARMKGPAVVSLSPVQIRDLVQTFDATGSVEAPLSVKIAPKITGRIEYLRVREGDRVRKGQVLVRIDASQVEAEVQQQRAALAEAQYRLAQAQMGQAPADVAVNTQIRQQRAAVASAEADFNQARKSFDAQVAAAQANVTDATSRVDTAGAALSGARANLANAKAKYDRIHSLYSQGFIAAQEVDDAKAALDVQQSAVEMAQAQVRSANAQLQSATEQLSIVREKSKADVEASRAKLVQAKGALEYASASTSQKQAYRQSIAALRAGVSAAEAAVRSANARRLDTVLVSPLDGYVTGRHSDPGAIASPSQPILSVQFMKQLWVTLGVPDAAVARIHIGQPATVAFDAMPGRTFAASVIQVNPAAEQPSRQFQVRVLLSNAGGQIKPGMFGRVRIETERVRNATVVVREAVRDDRDGAFVMLAAEGKAKRVGVARGPEDENYVSIGTALRPGQKVVAMSANPVREGQALKQAPAGGGPPGGRRQGAGAP